MLRLLAWTFGGAFAAAALTLLGGIVLPELIPISQSEGAYMMSVIFFVTPAAFLIGAVIGLILGRAKRQG